MRWISPAFVVLFAAHAFGQSPVSVPESRIRAELRNNSTVIIFPVDNTSGAAIPATLSLAWLDTNNAVLTPIQRDVSLAPGQSTIETSLPISDPSIWLRLRYTLTPDVSAARVFPQRQGIVALSQIAAWVFELSATQIGTARPGAPLLVHAQAIHPATRLPVTGASWKATLNIGDTSIDPVVTLAHPEGLVDFTFDVPADADEERSTVVIRAIRGDFNSQLSLDIPMPDQPSARIQTDKPIYQPGQIVHFRAVVLNPQGRALENAALKLEITDPENDRAHTARLTTSRFGVVHDDFTLPASPLLGSWQIALKTEDGAVIGSHVVVISRYELPAFSVTAKPDRSAYLPGQSARVTVVGTYLFGKPVPNGKVRITRRRDNQWDDPRSPRSPTDDTAIAEGVAAQDGTFTATIDLASGHDDLHDSDTRFQDLHFVVWYTDPSSNRTEQRRFDLRVSREPIHVYIIPSASGGSLPAPVYVSTSYADGRPVSAKVDLRYGTRTASLRTNRYGVGKDELIFDADAPGQVEARAEDDSGEKGQWSEPYYRAGRETFRIESARTLYRAGESVSLDISAPPPEAGDFVVIQAVAGDRSVVSQIAHLVNGRAHVDFPWRSEFRRKVVFVAWKAAANRSGYGDMLASKAVVFPDASSLHILAEPAHSTYRPGDPASLRMQVTSDGRPAEAAIGLAVVDQSVFDRAQTDADFGYSSWFDCSFCDSGETEIAGIGLSSLYTLKPSSPLSAELDVVAEALLASPEVAAQNGASEDLTATSPFRGFPTLSTSFGASMIKFREALDRHYANTLQFPTNSSSLSAILGSDWTSLRDPWGLPWIEQFSIERQDYVIRFLSSGPDKQPGTADDFEAGRVERSWVRPIQVLIGQSLKNHGDYPATEDELSAILADDGMLLATLRDPWGTPLRPRISTQATLRHVVLWSAGPDRAFDTDDDFIAATFAGTWFQRERRGIAEALASAPQAPQTLEEFRSTLSGAGIDIAAYRDPWGRPYRLTGKVSSQYGDRIDSTTVRIFGSDPAIRTSITPVTQQILTFALHSDGPDGDEGTYDDFDVTSFSSLPHQESVEKSDAAKQASPTGLAKVMPGTGVIAGTVADTSDSPLANATVLLTDSAGATYSTRTDSGGNYGFTSVPSGVYGIKIVAAAFQNYEVRLIPVTPGRAYLVDATLQIRSVSESISVSAEVTGVQTQTAGMSALLAPLLATPRVREYFPETMLWLPEVVTGTDGIAQIPFTMADTVTTWKIAAIASTPDGRFAETESSVRSFQPFFLDFSPPQILTQGDRLDLPVTVRNYTNHAIRTSLHLLPNAWFSLQGSATKEVPAPANSSVNATFALRAGKIADSARQRISAIAPAIRDAIEKPIRIHPDGREVTQTLGDLMAGSTSMSLPIPANAIAGASRAELRLYPNLASLLFESAAAVLETPHGCAEQTISAGYANLVALRYARAAGIADLKVESRGLANIEAARASLAAFRSADGGISYWQDGKPDPAVTAYALTFILDAADVVGPDEVTVRTLAAWLQSQQDSEGKWKPSVASDRQTLLLTGHVIRALAAARKSGITVPDKVFAAAYHHLALFTDSTDEPYLFSEFILAALDSGHESLLGDAAVRLIGMAQKEKDGVYWDLHTNSPFYGWGTAGRFESTGLAISALVAWRTKHPDTPTLDSSVRRGLVFLLHGRDALGSWSSTQATVRAMHAMADAAPILGAVGGGGGAVEVRANGHLVRSLVLSSDAHAADPVVLDVSAFLQPGDNLMDLIPAAGVEGALLRLTSSHWLPWTQPAPQPSPELRLAVAFDHNPAGAIEASVGDSIRCSVKAERVGFRGYGMMLAEIGLPPGAEVERESLETVLSRASLGVYRYDVLPDRVVFYLWPEAGGASFDFTLRTRISMNAKSAASKLYDYYNPEALSEVAPLSWNIH